VLLAWLFVAASPRVTAPPPRSPALNRQVTTASSIRTLRLCVEIYRSTHKGEAPPSLEIALRELYPNNPPAVLTDAWGRRFTYYGTRDHLLIISFGADGKPDAGDVATEGENCDFVSLDDQWIRIPMDVDR